METDALQQVCENLTARGFTARVFPDAAAVVDYLDDAIDATDVGFGGSLSLRQIGLYDRLAAHNVVRWHWVGGPQERLEAMRTEVYVSSANALASTGELVNIDGAGNRVASTLFGHRRVYFVVGRNKVVPTLENAIWRARNVAAPRNAKRLGVETPCAVKADRCYDCRSPQRICRGLTVLWAPMMDIPTEVLLVREDLGL